MFNEGLAKVKASGTYDEIYAKWISGDGSAPPMAAGACRCPPRLASPSRSPSWRPLSGDVKTFGESTRDGALMAFEEATAAGWEIEAVIADSKCDAAGSGQRRQQGHL